MKPFITPCNHGDLDQKCCIPILISFIGEAPQGFTALGFAAEADNGVLTPTTGASCSAEPSVFLPTM